MLKDFKAFVLRGSVLDLAVAVIIAGAFGAIVNSMVKDVLMPPIGLVLGRVSFGDLFFSLDGKHYDTLEAAAAAGAPTVNYGLFLQAVASFLIVAAVIFAIVRAVSRLKGPDAAALATTRDCPFCLTAIPLAASRCAHCTSQMGSAG